MTEEENDKLELEDLSGFYEFKIDTKNQKSDRRKKRFANVPVFTAGTKVCLKRYEDEYNRFYYELSFNDYSSLKFRIKDLLPVLDQLKKTEPTYDQIIGSSPYSEQTILASLFSMGKISVADLQESITHIKNQTD